MVKRLLPAVVMVLFLAGLRPVGAQPAAPPLSELARGLVAYVPQQSDLPAGFRINGAVEEDSNEDLATASPNNVDAIRSLGRVTGISESALTPSGGSITLNAILFLTPDGAWGDAQQAGFPEGTETVSPRPAVGERSIGYHFIRRGGDNPIEAYYIGFQRDRAEGVVLLTGRIGAVSLDTILPIAQAMDARIIANPPPPVTALDRAALDDSPKALVRGTVRLLLDRFIDQLNVDDLLYEAWDAATKALLDAGVPSVPRPPVYTRDIDVAFKQHMEAFQQLETLAQGKLPPEQLAYAAIDALTNNRHDCHTYFYTAETWRLVNAMQSGGELPVRIGVSFSTDVPMRVVSIVPGSPAKAAGLREGQIVISINGNPVQGLSINAARAFIKPGEGEPNVFVVRNPSGAQQTVTVAPARFRIPPFDTEILEGNIGVIHMYQFQSNDEQFRVLPQIIDDFESKGVVGWIIDLRDNGGGSSALRRALTSLFLPDGGRIDGLISRGQAPVYTNATADPLPIQRPLVFLVNENSASAGEIMPAVLQLRGRAYVVGQQTAGCVGTTTFSGLLDGTAIAITRAEYVLGPNDTRLHRIGVTPNVVVPDPTPLELEQNRDPQILAALKLIADLLRGVQPPAPSTPAVTRISAVSF